MNLFTRRVLVSQRNDTYTFMRRISFSESPFGVIAGGVALIGSHNGARRTTTLVWAKGVGPGIRGRCLTSFTIETFHFSFLLQKKLGGDACTTIIVSQLPQAVIHTRLYGAVYARRAAA